jgi:hypothetical protein
MRPRPSPTQPLVAFRTWRIVDGELRSPYDDSVWTSAGLKARCKPRNAEDFARHDHVAPSVTCSCGISATAEPDMQICGVDATRVVGVVRMWGRVVLHGGELRAEHAQVVMLGAYLPWSRRQRMAAAQVAEQLGCALAPLETLRQQVAEQQATEVDEATIEALHGAVPVVVLVPGPRRRFVHAR